MERQTVRDDGVPAIRHVLQVHCRYLAGRSGEDAVVDEEKCLLEQRGHSVSQMIWENRHLIEDHSHCTAAIYSLWNPHAYRALRSTICANRPDIIHVHNTFAALSPSVLWAARRERCPVVVTLHNYRLICANAILFRNNTPCTQCMHSPLAAFLRGCQYNGSVAQGWCVAAMQMLHRAIGTYQQCVDVFIALSRFQKDLMIEGGLPGCRIVVKPNTAGPCLALRKSISKPVITFVGQLRSGKGIDLLLSAWSSIEHASHVLQVIGPGAECDAHRRVDADVVWRGPLPRQQTIAAIAESRWMALPSRLYEGCPMAVLEAKAAGTPAIVPEHGSFAELVQNGVDGFTFRPGDVESLKAALSHALSVSQTHWRSMSEAATAAYTSRYSDVSNYAQLMQAYRLARDTNIRNSRP